VLEAGGGGGHGRLGDVGLVGGGGELPALKQARK
jgi:hypothetical protein